MEKIPIRYIKGIGPRKEEIFNRKAQVYGLKDLFYYFPFRYEDRTNFVNIQDLSQNETAVIQGEVLARNLKKFPHFIRSIKIKSIFEVILGDQTAQISCKWFNQPYLADSLKVGQKIIVYGKATYYRGKLQMVAPKFEQSGKAQSLDIGKITPIYRLPAEFSQRFMRKTIFLALKKYSPGLSDPIPFDVRKKQNISNIAKSFQQIHFPASLEDADSARQRFIFEELFISQVRVYLRKAKHRFQQGPCLEIDKNRLKQIEKIFPFCLTRAQKEALRQILSDLQKEYPMRRLLQGDVGSGKTAVAIFPIILSALSSQQVAFMVPTEVLAYQHKKTIDNLLEKSAPPLSSLRGRIDLLTSSSSLKEKNLILKRLIQGDSLIVVGTHSLIQKKIKFNKLGLVVIDEQHKFGAAQRALLPKKSKTPPNCLVMSATPIPRSLALSLYGDLDLSTIGQLPPGRVVPETILIKEKNRKRAYDLIEEKIKEGRQAYIVYPIIDQNDNLEVKSLSQMVKLAKKRFSGFSLGIFHGRLENQEKIRVVNEFNDGKIDILVSTNVVEVGLDIKNATIMAVESPEKFGLSQLHQLRGRIGRSRRKSTFVLIYNENISQEAAKRLITIKKEIDGFQIAEADLKLRGPGDFFGQLQHGLPNLRIANPVRDLKILKEARILAREVIKKEKKCKF
ncbi:MAG: ATP-dependent DNA helicase RecG [Candidatus Omnitrophica bacterium]|nr:ATP-dependent DNA helicase RecG [Candidatus Omnitrophota bacterium]MCF7876855.1 ATP-dependent DNA helicase RecG [Candidatus Omnitrophota bacterium]MCF7877886.1 ATP-dependent DNA helicase RecG [Candidatus Omnitrophota bacterium]MCF7892578.1 ATP-dependent DNA helicase RecG [Candidatus Omnitrophota bacterium]